MSLIVPHAYEAALRRLEAAPARRQTGPQAQYDIVDSRNSAGGRKRRQPCIETKEEEGILTPRHRLGAINLTRDIVRNSPQARGLAKTLRVNVVGSYGKLRFNDTGPWFEGAQRWFNGTWARAVDWVDGTCWRECLQLAVYSITHEHDFVAVFDNGILSGRRPGTGRMAFFEGDQICDLNASDWQPFAARGYRQLSGVILDPMGRHCGVIVSRMRGQTETALRDALVLTRDPTLPASSAPWIHVRRKFRFRQARGVSDAVTALATVLDSHEILGYELQSAKAAAARYATVYAKDAPTEMQPGGFTDLGGESENNEAAAEAVAQEELEAEALERYTGGNVDYLRDGDKVEYPPTNRPNSGLQTFLDYTGDMAGAAHGLGHAYARMRADSSYTAFRGDMVMTWMTFADFQQFLEDNFSDWAAGKAIEHGHATGALAAPPEGWVGSIAWQYPTMPAVDEAREQDAQSRKLKNGLALYREMIGPHWREHFQHFAEEINLARELNLPISVLETVAGAMAAGNKGSDDENA